MRTFVLIQNCIVFVNSGITVVTLTLVYLSQILQSKLQSDTTMADTMKFGPEWWVTYSVWQVWSRLQTVQWWIQVLVFSYCQITTKHFQVLHHDLVHCPFESVFKQSVVYWLRYGTDRHHTVLIMSCEKKSGGRGWGGWGGGRGEKVFSHSFAHSLLSSLCQGWLLCLKQDRHNDSVTSRANN